MLDDKRPMSRERADARAEAVVVVEQGEDLRTYKTKRSRTRQRWRWKEQITQHNGFQGSAVVDQDLLWCVLPKSHLQQL